MPLLPALAFARQLIEGRLKNGGNTPKPTESGFQTASKGYQTIDIPNPHCRHAAADIYSRISQTRTPFKE